MNKLGIDFDRLDLGFSSALPPLASTLPLPKRKLIASLTQVNAYVSEVATPSFFPRPSPSPTLDSSTFGKKTWTRMILPGVSFATSRLLPIDELSDRCEFKSSTSFSSFAISMVCEPEAEMIKLRNNIGLTIDLGNGRKHVFYTDGSEYWGKLNANFEKEDLQGVFLSKHGTRYEGPFERDKQNGGFNVTWEDGSTYVGNMVNGIKKGHGIFISRRKNIIVRCCIGNFDQDKMYDENGRITDAKGTYIGGVRRGKKNGYGTQVSNDRARLYEGTHVDDEATGTGTVTTANGIYTGDVLKGKRHGNGTYKWKGRKISYVGTFENDKITGIGTLTDSLGTYTGSVLNGYRHGRGKFEWKDGDRSCEGEGTFAHGQMNGPGTETGTFGTYTGNFLNGLRHDDNGTFKWKDGKKSYVGTFTYGQMTGKGVETDVFGVYTGGFLSGQRHGDGTFRWFNGGGYSAVRYDEGVFAGLISLGRPPTGL